MPQKPQVNSVNDAKNSKIIKTKLKNKNLLDNFLNIVLL